MITQKHYDAILSLILSGNERPGIYKSGSGETWYGESCFAFRAWRPVFDEQLFTPFPFFKGLIATGQDNTDGYQLSGVSRSVKPGQRQAYVVKQLLPAASESGSEIWVQEKYLKLFPENKYAYGYCTEKRDSMLYCYQKDKNGSPLLLEGIICLHKPVKTTNEKGE